MSTLLEWILRFVSIYLLNGFLNNNAILLETILLVVKFISVNILRSILCLSRSTHSSETSTGWIDSPTSWLRIGASVWISRSWESTRFPSRRLLPISLRIYRSSKRRTDVFSIAILFILIGCTAPLIEECLSFQIRILIISTSCRPSLRITHLRICIERLIWHEFSTAESFLHSTLMPPDIFPTVIFNVA